MALMVEWGTEAFIPNARFISLPVQSLSIANVLNGKMDSKGYTESSGVTRFTFPQARILAVDDIATNLKVVEGLLAPYGAAVDTCLSGLQAIELVKNNEYDIVFMDHMMPGMDGIETTAAIRALEGERFKTVPIIALTANAVVGMREIFIENGFNDFLAKPIDVSKLDEMLDRWIPKEKRENRAGDTGSGIRDYCSDNNIASHNSPFPAIPGVDTAKGIVMTGGALGIYRQVLAIFCKDAEERLPLLQTKLKEENLLEFVTLAHALKSASASIGAADISAFAAELETAGKAGDMTLIGNRLPVFAGQLAGLVKNIRAALETDAIAAHNDIPPPESSENSLSVFISLLRVLEAALKSQSATDVDRIMEEIDSKQTDSKTRETLAQVSEQIMMLEYGNALAGIEKMLAADIKD
jgi:CheY-like chemotaxis protein